MIRFLYKTYFFLFMMVLATAAHSATIKDIRYNRLNDKGQLILTADGPLRFEQFTLSNPPRLVVDVINGIRHSKAGLNVNDGAIQRVRAGYHAHKNYRIVVDLNYPVRGRVYTKIMPNHINNQLFIDIFDGEKGNASPSHGNTPQLTLESLNPSAANSPLAQVSGRDSPLPPPSSATPRQEVPPIVTQPLFTNSPNLQAAPAVVITPPTQAPKPTTPPFRPRKEIVIAIDPGHGGKDPGAISRATGLKEKDVVLQIARRLKKRIDDRSGFRAVLTRDRDIFIPLHQRAAIARRHNADLFVSIHADAVQSVEPSGSSVYILSTKGATSQLAKYLESSENAVDLRWGVDVSKYNDDIQEALLTIQQEATLESSFMLAERTLRELRSIGKVHKSTVERANFVVLRSPEIPSMLVETAFISNPQEARKLATPAYQERLAAGIAGGIFSYFSEYLPQHILLGQ